MFKYRRRLCYPRARLENLTHKFQDIVKHTREDSVAVVQAGTNNVVQGKSEEILSKQGALIRSLKDSRRKVVVAGLQPMVNVGS